MFGRKINFILSYNRLFINYILIYEQLLSSDISFASSPALSSPEIRFKGPILTAFYERFSTFTENVKDCSIAYFLNESICQFYAHKQNRFEDCVQEVTNLNLRINTK